MDEKVFTKKLIPKSVVMKEPSNKKNKFAIFLFINILLTFGLHPEVKSYDLPPKKLLNNAVYVSNALQKINRDRSYEYIAIMKVFNESIKDGSIKEDNFQSILQKGVSELNKQKQYNSGYRFGKSQSEIFNSSLDMLSIAIKDPRIKAGTLLLKTLLKNIGDKSENDPYYRFLLTHQKNSTEQQMRNIAKETVEEFVKNANSDSHFKQLGDKIFGDYLNAKIGQDYNTVIKNNPELGSLNLILNKSQTIDAEMMELVKNWLNEISDKTKEDINTLKNIDNNQKDFIAYVKKATEYENLNRENEKKLRENQLKVEAVGAGIYLISSIFNFTGKEDVAKKINGVGNVALNVYSSVNKYAQSAAEFSKLGKTLGGIVLSANLIGAGVQLVSLFGSGPDPNQILLKEMTNIREDIFKLHQDMTERFDNIDKNLSSIIKGLNDNFFSIQRNFEELNNNIKDIKNQLYRIEDGVYSVYKLIQYSEFNREKLNFVRYVNLIDNPNHIYDANDETGLYTWANDVSLTFAKSSGFGQYADLMISKEFEPPFYTNINDLFQYINDNIDTDSIPKFSTDIHEPSIWSTGSIALLSANFSNFDKYTPNSTFLDILEKEGKKIKKNLDQITLIKNQDGSTKTNSKLFNIFFEKYELSLKDLTNYINGLEKNYKVENLSKDLQTNENPRLVLNKDVDMWNWQSITSTYEPNIQSTVQVTGNDGSSSVEIAPSNILDILPNEIKFAEQVGIHKLSFNIALSWEETRNGEKRYCGDPDPSKPKPEKTYESGKGRGNGSKDELTDLTQNISDNCVIIPHFSKLQIRLDGYWNGIQFFSRSLKTKQEFNWEDVTIRNNRDYFNQNKLKLYNAFCAAYSSDEWLRTKLIPEGFNFDVLTREKAIKNANFETYNKMRRTQQEYYRYLGIKIGSDDSLKNLLKIIDGRKRILEALVSLGLPQALENNDFLRSFFYGRYAILDYKLISQDYVNSLAVGLDSNVQQGTFIEYKSDLNKIDLQKTGLERLDEFNKVIINLLDSLQNGRIIESNYLVDNTLKMFKCYKDLRKEYETKNYSINVGYSAFNGVIAQAGIFVNTNHFIGLNFEYSQVPSFFQGGLLRKSEGEYTQQKKTLNLIYDYYFNSSTKDWYGGFDIGFLQNYVENNITEEEKKQNGIIIGIHSGYNFKLSNNLFINPYLGINFDLHALKNNTFHFSNGDVFETPLVSIIPAIKIRYSF